MFLQGKNKIKAIFLHQLLDIVCSTAQDSDDGILHKLDEKFKDSFMSPETTIEPSAFENLFGMYAFCNQG